LLVNIDGLGLLFELRILLVRKLLHHLFSLKLQALLFFFKLLSFLFIARFRFLFFVKQTRLIRWRSRWARSTSVSLCC